MDTILSTLLTTGFIMLLCGIPFGLTGLIVCTLRYTEIVREETRSLRKVTNKLKGR